MQKQLTVGWKVSTLNLALASLRYRAVFPMLALERHGVKSKIFTKATPNSLVGLDALVIVKSFTIEDYWLAQEATRLNIPVIFDLCDNIFIDQYRGKNHTSPADVFSLIAGMASAIVVTTEPLAHVVQEQLGTPIPVHVVPDGVENKALLDSARTLLRLARAREYIYRLRSKARSIIGSVYRALTDAEKLGNRLLRAAKRHLLDRLHPVLSSHLLAMFAFARSARVRSRTNVASGTLPQSAVKAPVVQSPNLESDARKAIAAGTISHKILWFGNHGATHADFGMLDLLSIRAPLEKIASELPVELVVVSNHAEKYRKHIRPMAIPSRYMEWSTESIAQQLEDADVVVIPNSLDAFSICKSANRSVLALSSRVPVVATSTPALEALRECITLDDFEGGLRRYLTDSAYAQLHVQQGLRLIEHLYGQQVIGRLWNEILEGVCGEHGRRQEFSAPELIVAIQLPQDIDLARPLLDDIHRCGIQCAVWTSIAATKRWPQIVHALPDLSPDWRILPESLKGFDSSIFPRSAFALLTVTETNLGPHRFTHQLTKLANAAGLFTATLQHGYENVGLTYSDNVNDIQRIQFASQRIYTWGGVETLHPDVRQEVRNKCLPVGCPKPTLAPQATLPDEIANGQPIIGIFENLHWQRYSNEYRQFFLEGVSQLAEAFPSVVFLIKPHNAGMWLTSRYKGEKPEAHNLIIADPKDPAWESITATQLLSHLAAVITAPSTVALDAARVELPTAIVAHELDLENYAPLPLIRQMEDWSSFISQALDSKAQQFFRQRSRQFVERVLLPGNAASRILEEIIKHKQQQEIKHAA